MPKVVGARELKTRLGKYLRAVRGGATIVVSERGRPVAELRPLPTGVADVEARLDDLVTAGALTRGSGAPLPKLRPARVRGPSVSAALAEDREDRF